MSTYYGTSIVTSGLTVCLDPANTKCYPGTGTTLVDLSGNGNNGTIQTGASYSSGYITLDGVSGYILLGPIAGIGIATTSFTFGIWVYGTTANGNIVSMSSTNPSGGWNEPPIRASGQQYQGHIYSNPYIVSAYNLNTWYYLTLVFDYTAGAQYFYVNGVSAGSNTGITYGSSGTSNYLFLGQANPGANNAGMFAGRIGAFHTYTSKALTAAEVLQNFNALRTRYGL